MKKPIFPRIVSLILIYLGVFILLVMIQFTRKGSFTRQIGSFVVSGYYGNSNGNTAEIAGEPDSSRDDQKAAPQVGEYPLDGEVSIFFGGMEFLLTVDDDHDSLGMVGADGKKENSRPLSMSVSGESARFLLAGGVELSFDTQYAGSSQELRIYALLPEGLKRLELPYRPLRSSRIRHSGDGEYQIIADGKSYRFNNSTVDPARRLVLMDSAEPVISYGAVPGGEVFDPSNLIISSAKDKQSYDEALNRFLDRSFPLWHREIENNPTDDAVIAYITESIQRNDYSTAVAEIPESFLGNSRRNYESSAFLGRMDQGLRSIAAFERDSVNRLSRLIRDKSPDFLKDTHIVEFLAIRDHNELLDETPGIIEAIDPAALDPALIPGILEGYTDWELFRKNKGNPFEGLTGQACFSITEDIKADKQGERIFVFHQGEANTEFNLRLGAALVAFGENPGQEIWGGIGRSLILSALSLADTAGMIPQTLGLAENGSFTPAGLLSSARIYRVLRLGENIPRALNIDAMASNIWTWTAATAVLANFNQENKVLDISVSFPSGETHYMLIRGIQSFQQIQLYNIPFRTDPQFERYDSSGWSYSPSEQTLMIKMKHRLTTEHIQIFY
ncbi:hypothetical protein [Treponema primitia]|uniref:hypothetical protein n=1 Tax=Treponema primitia TaxID=88058 RepID=UPI000311A212|nr:hypothetical protein [Treponema primitia]